MAALTIACAASIALADSAAVYGGGDSSSAAVLRAQPDSGAKVIGRFFGGAPVEVLSDAGNGYKSVSFGSGLGTVSGYMAAECLSEGTQGNATHSANVVSPYGTQSVVLRDRPSNSYDAVAMLMVGESVLIIGEMDGFWYVQTGSGCVGCLLDSELK